MSVLSPLPRLIKRLCDHRIAQVMCGNQHCIALSKGRKDSISLVFFVRLSVVREWTTLFFSVEMASCSRGVRTPAASSDWGRASPASCFHSPSSLWQGFHWQRSPRAETTASPSLCPELCLDGARTKLDNWVSMIFKVSWINGRQSISNV